MLIVAAIATACVSVGPTTSGSPSFAVPSLPSASLPSITLPPTPTFAPTPAVTLPPTSAPTLAPTDAPTTAPTDAPTAAPTDAPTDVPTDAPSTTAGTLDFTLPSNYGEATLSGGYNPDPYTKSGIRSGGSVDASYIGGCNGYASSAPDFQLNYTAGQVFTLLRFYFIPDTAGADTTLIINQPNAQFACDDDYSFPDNRNPEVNIDPAASGTYDIWIGNYSSDTSTFVTGTLYITQLQENHPE